MQQNNRVIGIDTGGTFTDFVYYNQGQLSIHKITLLFGIDNKVPVYQREQLLYGHSLSGPALVVEQVATTWVAEHWNVQVDRYGNLRVTKKPEEKTRVREQ